jgi:prepilin-type N-terminal cleavage/methylation domain-containing protein
MKKNSKQSGFTLIEVVLVLAIGGLIFLLAFLAFRQVSVNRRDTQRRNDAGRVLAEIQNFAASGGGVTLTSDVANGTEAAGTGICTTSTSTNLAAAFSTVYLCKDGKFLSPSGRNYSTIAHNSATKPTQDQLRIGVVLGAPFNIAQNGCDGNPLPEGGYVIEIGLEKGVACRDSR